MDIIEIIDKLIGSIKTYRESNWDRESYENLDAAELIVMEFVKRMIDNAEQQDSGYASEEKIAMRCHNFLKELSEEIDDYCIFKILD